MNIVKKQTISIAVFFSFFFFWTLLAFSPSHARASDDLLEVLQEKGILNKKEVAGLRKERKKDPRMNHHWGKGIRFQSRNKIFKFKLGGRIFYDWAFMKDESNGIRAAHGKLNETMEFRATRLYLEGQIYGNVIHKTQLDFVNGTADFKDVFIGLKGLPFLGTVKAGHHKEPFSLEEFTSHRFVTFMERALPNVFSPGRNTGVSFFNTAFKNRATYSAGLFMDAGAFGNESGTESNFHATMRLTGLPWYAAKNKLIHLGFGYSFREVTDNSLRFRQRPEVHTGPRFIDTGAFGANSENRFGGEIALVYGPFSIQSEVMGTHVNVHGGGQDPTFHGYYVYGSWFLTGEHRNYVMKKGGFDRITPNRNFGKGGYGAVELGVRFSSLDLNDRLIRGGQMDNITVGLNWYLNPNTRVMLNYINSDVDQVGDANMFQTRVQVDF